jgi:hypothetical protein
MTTSRASAPLEAEPQRQLGELYGEIGRPATQLAWLKKIWPRTWPALNAWRCWKPIHPS